MDTPRPHVRAFLGIRVPGWLRRQDALFWGGLLLAVLYTAAYLGHPALPGNNAAFPLGWWGWWDQSNYLKSTLALSRLDFAADQHLYPLGYALLAAPLARLMPTHPFYFIDLLALLVTLGAFVAVARRLGLARGWATLVFVLAAADPVLFAQWVIPWTTTPLAMLLWLLLAVAMAHIDGDRRPVALGLLSASVAMLRPTDLLLALPPLAACLLADWRGRRLARRDLPAFALAVLLPALLYGALHLRIYGPAPSPYMQASRNIGFSLHHFGWKAYVILVDPRAWFGGGEGLLRRCPWMILGFAGLVPAMRCLKTATLAVMLLLHGVLYIAYVDLLPSGFWRYMNVHYWTWALPGFALLGVKLLYDFRPTALFPAGAPCGARRLPGLAGLAAAGLLLSIRFSPVPAQAGESIDAVDFAIPPPGFDAVYFGPLQVTDARGTLANVSGMRAIPLGDSIRVLALTRPLLDPIRLQGSHLDAAPAVRLHARLGFGPPFRPWRAPDAFYGPQ